MSGAFPQAFLSPTVIIEALKQAFSDITYVKIEKGVKIRSVSCGFDPDPSCCSIFDDPDQLAGIDMKGRIAVVSGRPKENDKDLFSVIYAGSDPGAHRIYAQIQKCLSDFFRWDSDLLNAAVNNLGIANICRTGYEYFKNPIMVHDSNFVVMARFGRGEEVNDADYDHRLDSYIYQKNVIKMWMRDREMNDTMSKTGASWQTSPKGYDLLFYNIRDVNGLWAGRIVLLPDKSELTEGTRFLFDHFGKIVNTALKLNPVIKNKAFYKLKKEFSDYLDNEQSSYEALESAMSINGWRRDDLYICALIRNKDAAESKNFTSAVFDRMESELAGTCFFEAGAGTIAVINCRITGAEGNAMRKLFMDNIDADTFSVGFSTMFSDLSDLRTALLQASATLDLASPVENGKSFKDVQTKYLSKLIHNGNLTHSILINNLLILHEYDEKKGTHLMETLKVYLESACNIRITSEIFGINRTTTYYRLGKIQKLIRLNLEDPGDRLLLSILLEACYDDLKSGSKVSY